MLRMLPGVSEARAATFAKKYTCPRKLLEVTQANGGDLVTLLDQQLQFQFDFTDSGTGSDKRKKPVTQKKLSKLIYRTVTAENPEELIDVEDEL
jgi:hypothetical protein